MAVRIFCPSALSSDHHFIVILDSRSHGASKAATTAGRWSRFCATRHCPANCCAASSIPHLAFSSIDEGRCFWNVFQNFSSAFHAGFGSGHFPSPGGNSTSSLSQMVANAESRSFGRMSASSSAIMSGSPAARALVMNSRQARWRSSRSCTSSSSVKPGDTPDSTGRSRSRRAQNE